MTHKWSLGLFDDGSGVWLNEWRNNLEYRCWCPNKAKPTEWELDNSYPQFRGYDKNKDYHISSKLAKEILAVWKLSRKKKMPWIEL